jgi:NAD(P)-dependent dehydrogenase (short-subunit alcohol dehydrogenase family)
MGRATAVQLARNGFHVALADRDEDGLAELAAEITATGSRALEVPLDVTDEDAVEAAFARCDAELGPVWALAAAAGVYHGGFALDSGIAHFAQRMDINFLGVVRTNVAAARRMVAAGQGGRIVNWASVSALGGTPGYGAYSASKAAVVSFTQSFALELASHGITVNVILPGTVRTPMIEFLSAEEARAAAANTPLGRVAEPEQITCAVDFFMSEGAAWVTATSLRVDGGWAAAMGRRSADAAREHLERRAAHERSRSDNAGSPGAHVAGPGNADHESWPPDRPRSSGTSPH